MQNSSPPRKPPSLHDRLRYRVDDLRHQLAYTEALPQLTALGFMVGLIAGVVIVLFRYAVDLPLGQILAQSSEGFESLEPAQRMLLCSGGGLLIGLLLSLFSAENRRVSVAHVIDRVHNHQARLPFKNFLVQFLGGILCLISGQSVGREGPAVHLGGASASLIGQWLKLPHNSLRTLVACGVAAAIAACFNTPIAGVIFAMEVVLMEYTIIGFIPVILASAAGAMITQLVYGPEPAFSLTAIHMNSLWELPYMAAVGVAIATIAAVFVKMTLAFQKLQHWSIILRCTLAGVITGTIAFAIPQVMGVGYDTVTAVFQGQVALPLLIMIVAGKLIATAACTGLGQPGGLIGPIFMIGACCGAIMGTTGEVLMPDSGASAAFYITVGMGGMVAAVLNAPLAALLAVLELTYNPNILFPSMVVIVVACVTTRHVFRCDSIFLSLLAQNQTELHNTPLRQALERAAVRSVMDTDFVTTPYQVDYSQAHSLLRNQPRWLVAEELGRSNFLIRASSLAAFLEAAPDEVLTGESLIDLRTIPAERWQLSPINEQASLYEAHRRLQEGAVEALKVESNTLNSPLISPVLGIIIPRHIEEFYQL